MKHFPLIVETFPSISAQYQISFPTSVFLIYMLSSLQFLLIYLPYTISQTHIYSVFEQNWGATDSFSGHFLLHVFFACQRSSCPYASTKLIFSLYFFHFKGNALSNSPFFTLYNHLLVLSFTNNTQICPYLLSLVQHFFIILFLYRYNCPFFLSLLLILSCSFLK